MINDGLLLIDKPPGLTSMDVVREVKDRLSAQKAGHTGTLDPIATGLLPVCLGKTTKVSQYLLNAKKEYRAEFLLGKETDTLDSEGKIVREVPLPKDLNRRQLEEIFKKFVGEITQIPPIFSAVKIGGKRAYQLARSGKELQLAPRKVKIYKLTLEEFTPPRAIFKCTVSKGTYIRALIRDIGSELGLPTYMTKLRRLGVSPYRIEDAIPLENLSSKTELKRPYFIPLEELFPNWPKLSLSQRETKLLQNGNIPKTLSPDKIQFPNAPTSLELPLQLLAYSHRGKLLAILQYNRNKFRIIRVL